MAKKKVMVKPKQSVCNHSKVCFVLMGMVLVALGLWAYLGEANNLKLIVALALVLLGLKKILMAAKHC